MVLQDLTGQGCSRCDKERSHLPTLGAEAGGGHCSETLWARGRVVCCEGKMLKGLGYYFRSAFQASFGFGSRVSGLWVSWEPRPPEHGLAGAERGCVASSGSPVGARRDPSDCASAGGWWVHVPSLQLGTRPLSPSHLECSPWPCPRQGWWEPICGKHLLGKEGQIALHLPPLLLAGMEMERCSYILELGWEVKRKGV